MTQHRIGAAALAALALGGILSSCATKVTAPQLKPKAQIEAKGWIPLDQYRSRLDFSVELENPGTETLTLEASECLLFADGAELGRAAGAPTPAEARSIEAGNRASIPFAIIVDSRKLGGAYASSDGPSTVAYRLEARLALKTAAGGRSEAKASAGGIFPIVREPRLEILSLKIERDILVTTNLRLAIKVHNPNAFPIALRSIAYEFDGERKPWGEGRTEGPFRLGASSSGRIELAIEMNFADRDRELLDLVNNLQVVQFRLAGTASVDAELGVPLVFPLAFDEEGSCRVER